MTHRGHSRPEINGKVGELRHSRNAGAVLNIGHGIQGVEVPFHYHPDSVTLEKGFAALPLATYEAGEIVLAAGSKTGRLLFLRKGAAAVIRDGIEIARVSEPGAVFGEISALLDQPHSADVRAVETSSFTSGMRPLCKTWPRFTALRRSWHVVLTAPIRRSWN